MNTSKNTMNFEKKLEIFPKENLTVKQYAMEII